MAVSRRVQAATLALLVAAATGCGTTVRDSDVAASGGSRLSADGSGSGVAGSVGSGVSGATAGGAGGGGTSGGTGASGGLTGAGTSTGAGTVTGGTGTGGGAQAGTTGRSGGTSGTGSSGTAGTAGTGGQGGTGTAGGTVVTGPAAQTTGAGKLAPVEVGIVYIPDADAFANLFGQSAKVGDQKAEAAAAVKWVNDHGGLGGHPIVPVYYSQSITDTSPYATSMQAICSAFTQDHKVVASLFIGATVPNDLARCLSAKKVLHMSGGNYLHDTQDYRDIPYLISPYEAPIDQAARALLRNLDDRRWIGPKDRVGVMLAANEPAAVRTFNNVMAPALKAKGVPFAAYNVDFPSSTVAVSQSLQQVQNAVLKAKANGVTKVVFLAPGTEATFFSAADQQKYKPDYAMMSISGPYALQIRTSFPKSQLANTVGIGWYPIADVGAFKPNQFPNANKALCRQIMAPTGQITSDAATFASLQWCAGLFALRDAAIAAGSQQNLSADTLIGGFNALGSRHVSTMVLSSRFGPDRHAGASSYLPFSYATGCSCFSYSGRPTPFS